MNQSAVNVPPLPGRCGDLVLGDEKETVRSCPGLQQILERFAHDRFAVGAGDLSQILQLVQVLIDEELAQGNVII